jgi:hypothetical protein
MIFRTDDGHEFTKVVEAYGRLVESSGGEWKEICEARFFLAVPLEHRRREMELTAKKRSGGEKDREKTILAHLEALVTREWKWRRDQKAKAA